MKNYRKKGLRALGLSFLAVLGLMAFMAASAQAGWLVLHPGPGAVEPHVDLEVEVEEHVDGLLLVPGLNLEILCKDVKGESIKLLLLSTLTTGALLFDNCLTFSKNATTGHLLHAGNCTPTNQPILAGGQGHLVLDGGVNYLLFKPNSGKPFTVVEFPELCALVETSEVTGSLLAECGHLSGGAFVGLDCKNHQTEPLLRERPVQGTGHGLIFGEKSATIDGIAKARIVGPVLYVGVSFGGHV